MPRECLSQKRGYNATLFTKAEALSSQVEQAVVHTSNQHKSKEASVESPPSWENNIGLPINTLHKRSLRADRVEILVMNERGVSLLVNYTLTFVNYDSIKNLFKVLYCGVCLTN